MRPWVWWLMLRLGIAPITLNPMLSRSMKVTFCEGAIYPSPAAIASVTFSAWIILNTAVIVVSAGESAENDKAGTCPRGVTEAKSNISNGRIGPLSLHRRVRVFGVPSATLMMDWRVRNFFQPSSVRYSVGVSALTSSIRISWSSR